MKRLLMIFLILSNLSFSQEIGIASHYSVRTNGGTRTASGEKLCDNSFTAAHKKLPFGTKVKVTNLKNNKSVVVRITNRGPYIRGRIIDVSQAAAHALGFHKQGLTKVKVEVVKK
jgi:rare lipoprotein A